MSYAYGYKRPDVFYTRRQMTCPAYHRSELGPGEHAYMVLGLRPHAFDTPLSRGRLISPPRGRLISPPLGRLIPLPRGRLIPLPRGRLISLPRVQLPSLL